MKKSLLAFLVFLWIIGALIIGIIWNAEFDNQGDNYNKTNGDYASSSSFDEF